MKKNKINITEDSIALVILKMSGGMLFGLAAMSAFNAVDTYFMGQLGATELAAMSFTFPIVMIMNSISLGLGVGLSSTVSRAIGSGDHHKVQRLATDGIALAVLIAILTSICGILTVRPLFELLGAQGRTLDLIQDYMFIWYIGIPFVVIPMVGNNIIRATGDTLTPSIIMIISVIVNIILDPLLIFGIGPFPQMGISGAAIATVFARLTTLIFSSSILVFREKLISLKFPGWAEVLNSWKKISFVGVPAALVQVITPLSLGVITSLLSQYGDKVIAGFGAASRIEMIILIIPMSLSTVIAPFAGQNWGAKKIQRIITALKFSSLISILWGISVFIIFIFFADSILNLFNTDTTVVNAGANYLKIISLSYGFLGILSISTQSFSSLNKPLESAGITILKAFIINLPLALLGAHFWQETGIFFTSLISNFLGGIIGFYFLFIALKKQSN